MGETSRKIHVRKWKSVEKQNVCRCPRRKIRPTSSTSMAPFVPMRKGVQTFKINAQFTEKTGKAIKNTISSKAIGPVGTSPLMMKHIGHEGIRSLTSLQKLIYLDGDYPGHLQEKSAEE